MASAAHQFRSVLTERPETYESLVWGNLRKVLGRGHEVYLEWFERYGPNVQYRGLLLVGLVGCTLDDVC